MGGFRPGSILLAAAATVAAMYVLVETDRARSLLDRARRLEDDNKPGAAAVGYWLIVDRHPLSLHVPEAREGFLRNEPAVPEALLSSDPEPRLVDRLLACPALNAHRTDQVPLLASCAALLLLLIVAATRGGLSRLVTRLALLLMIPAALGAWIPLEQAGILTTGWTTGVQALTPPSFPLYQVTLALAAAAVLLSFTRLPRRQTS